jgi:hypothetical protein
MKRLATVAMRAALSGYASGSKLFGLLAATTLIGLVLPATPAAIAQSANPSDVRIEELLHTLQQLQRNTGATRSPVSVHGTYRFVVNVVFPKGFDFTGKLFCQVSVSHSSSVGQSFVSQRTIPMTLGSESAKCTNLVPYAYDEADSGLPIFPDVFIFTRQTTAAAPHEVISSKRLGPKPLPANGATTTFNVDFEM